MRGKPFQLFLQKVFIPTSLKSQFIVGNDIGAFLCLCQAGQDKNGHFLHAEAFCGLKATVTGDNALFFINEDRIRPTELFN